LPFVTIDSASTKDMDDALYITTQPDGWQLTIAIADPTAYVTQDSELDQMASQRAFTNYLPGFNIPMLPRELSDNLCSLREGEKRPALLCRVTVKQDGSLCDDAHFFAGWIESHGKLVYDNISDWLEGVEGAWSPENETIAEQITELHKLALARTQWRSENTLVFKDRPDYRFILDENGVVTDIVAEYRRIANRMVEEAMILANECAATVLTQKVGFGIYNAHAGFDPEKVEQAMAILSDNGVDFDRETLLSLDGFCQLRRQLDAMPTAYLDGRIRRFQAYSEVSAVPAPHFGLGLNAYATWTSPIRKYGDMVNHRLLKAVIRGEQPTTQPSVELTTQLADRRRFNRMSERDVGDWLYSRFLQPKVADNTSYRAEIMDVTRGGLRVRLLDNGAVAFVPAPLIHSVRDELECSTDTATVSIKGQPVFRLGDTIDVLLKEVRMETRSIIAKPVPNAEAEAHAEATAQ
ncbi:MAG: exoribonuclease II, partial [Plesiomonas sp.]